MEVLYMLFLMVAASLISQAAIIPTSQECAYDIVQTIPDGQTYPSHHAAPFPVLETWLSFQKLIEGAKKKIQISSFYLTLIPEDPIQASHPTANPGRDIFEALIEAASVRKLDVELVLGTVKSHEPELIALTEAGVKIKFLEVENLTNGGCHHTKFIITDEENFYIGSANWDWRALSHVQEFGLVYWNCPKLASDIQKIFLGYSYLADQTVIPDNLPEYTNSDVNSENPLTIFMDNSNAKLYFATSPKILEGRSNHRSSDLDAIVETINNAEEFIYATVMTFNPMDFGHPLQYWDTIERALKIAYYNRRVTIRLLVSRKNKFNSIELGWYRSLSALSNNHDTRYGGIEVRYFDVPIIDEFQANLPYSRLHHDKYMVTDKNVFIGTSNWQPSYFTRTTGVGLVIKPEDRSMPSIIEKMRLIFERDYYSKYARLFDRSYPVGSVNETLFKLKWE